MHYLLPVHGVVRCVWAAVADSLGSPLLAPGCGAGCLFNLLAGVDACLDKSILRSSSASSVETIVTTIKCLAQIHVKVCACTLAAQPFLRIIAGGLLHPVSKRLDQGADFFFC